MEQPIRVVSAREVRALIARAILSADPTSPEERLRSIVLHPHQTEAVRRLAIALEEFGGALLADEVGMGKTFVALALAARFSRPLVVGPAVLRDMWSQQACRAGIEIPFVSLESLSRGHSDDASFDLIVIDEAHHLRNPATRRYRELSRMAMHARVLMLSATPVHNRRHDLTAMLAIFLGSQAESLSASDTSRCVIRRSVESVGLVHSIPRIPTLVWKELRDDPRVPAVLVSLPPPLPLRDGGVAGVLVARSLIRQWCSSDAALEAALRRRVSRSIALIAALESGHYPSQAELSAWTVADDSVQLAFPSIVATAHDNTENLLRTINEHQMVLCEILRSLDPMRPRDRMRAEFLKEIRRAHPGIPVVCFSQYTETVTALFRELRREPGIAVLTAKGARVAGGALTRREALERFAPRASGARPPRTIDRIDVLLATDLLSEGVNLQDAGVVVHLDLPWTAARVEQRMGRVARMGSAHAQVYAYGIRPPAAAEILVRLEATIAAKMMEAEAIRVPTVIDERIRAALGKWSVESDPLCEGETRVAVVESRRAGFLALCLKDSSYALRAYDGHRVTNEPAAVLDCLEDADGSDSSAHLERISDALNLLELHLSTENTVGLTGSQSTVAAHARGAALRRVSAIVQKARPHERGRILGLAIDARRVILGRLGVAAEAELVRHVKSHVPDEKWLAMICANGIRETVAAPGEAHVTALLILDQR